MDRWPGIRKDRTFPSASVDEMGVSRFDLFSTPQPQPNTDAKQTKGSL
jgi:hypothetical protein